MNTAKKKPFFFVTLPLLLWAALILTLTSIPGESMPEITLWNWDKIAHLGVYGVLGFLLVRYLFFVRRRPLTSAGTWALVIGALFGIADELHQRWIPNRSGTWQDVVADICGVALGVYVATRYLRRKSNIHENDSRQPGQ